MVQIYGERTMNEEEREVGERSITSCPLELESSIMKLVQYPLV